MKRLAMLVVLVSFGLFALGCEETKKEPKKDGDKKTESTDKGAKTTDAKTDKDTTAKDETPARAEGRGQDRRGPARRGQDTRRNEEGGRQGQKVDDKDKTPAK